MAKKINTNLTIRDPKGIKHAEAAFISRALNGKNSYTAGTEYALTFTAAYHRHLSKPIDYAEADTSLLEDYIIHGYDYTIRAAAFTEWKRRIAQEKAK
jgi:hypothetical protein